MMNMEVIDHLLTTTRAVRKRLDLERPVEREVIERCIEIAIQAPTASNRQHWHFLVVTNPQERATIAEYYRKAFDRYIGLSKVEEPVEQQDSRQVQDFRVRQSAIYLAEHLHEVPVLIIPCIEGRVEKASLASQAGLYGSILPAVWNLMLALRARGLGSAWTTLHLNYASQVGEALGIPETVTQVALIPVAYYTGEGFNPAKRVPPEKFTYWNHWGNTEEFHS